MKRISLRDKILLWFTAALLIVVGFTYFMLLSVSSRILQKTVRDNLTEAVEYNYNEIRFYSRMEDVDFGKDASIYIEFASGYLEVSEDFLDEINQVYTGLYSADGNLLYGENPISSGTDGLAFFDSQVQTLIADGEKYYVMDRRLGTQGLEGIWLRGIVSVSQGTSQMTNITRMSLVLLPVLVLISVVGGSLIVRRMLRPIQQISDTAKQIGQENDLKKRIELGKGRDELHQLADTFNEMFDKLEKSFETQRQFISDASHELRTPMSVITAQCEYILESPRSREEYEEAFRLVQRQSRKMSKLIGDMLDFTRLEVGTERYLPERLNLSELAEDICRDMSLIGENGITLEYVIQPSVEFTGNPGLLSRLLMNLISNAYRYGRQDGHIRVTLRKEGQEILLSVADDGIGIAPEDQEKIFRRFYQADRSRSGAGIGLGLSMAAEIARFHGGKITVDSMPGRGSTFTVIFPADAVPRREPPEDG